MWPASTGSPPVPCTPCSGCGWTCSWWSSAARTRSWTAGTPNRAPATSGWRPRTARGAGLAGRLMRATLDLLGTRPSVLDAQTYLADFYAGLGYEKAGPEFVEDGIPHTPMTRPGSAQGSVAQGSVATSSAIDRR